MRRVKTTEAAKAARGEEGIRPRIVPGAGHATLLSRGAAVGWNTGLDLIINLRGTASPEHTRLVCFEAQIRQSLEAEDRHRVPICGPTAPPWRVRQML